MRRHFEQGLNFQDERWWPRQSLWGVDRAANPERLHLPGKPPIPRLVQPVQYLQGIFADIVAGNVVFSAGYNFQLWLWGAFFLCREENPEVS